MVSRSYATDMDSDKWREMMLVHPSSVNLNALGKQLLEASKNGDEEEVRSLMSQGAPFLADWLGMSPLHFSSMNGHLQTTELLARSGVSWNGRTKADKTPLHYAAQKGHCDIVIALLKLGADINAVDMLQMTPLHWAVVENHFVVVQVLVKQDAKLDIKNKFDRTVVESAECLGYFRIMEFLKESANHSQSDQTSYEEDTAQDSPVTDSSQAVLASFAALCGSPSLTDDLPWLNNPETGGGAAVLVEGTNMVALSEGGKMAMQTWDDVYEAESSPTKDASERPITTLITNQDSNEKILSTATENHILTSPVSHQLTRSAISSIERFKTKENTLPAGTRKRKLPECNQNKHTEEDKEPPSDHEEVERKLVEAQLQAAFFREKLQKKEQEVSLWKKKLENSQQAQT